MIQRVDLWIREIRSIWEVTLKLQTIQSKVQKIYRYLSKKKFKRYKDKMVYVKESFGQTKILGAQV